MYFKTLLCTTLYLHNHRAIREYLKPSTFARKVAPVVSAMFKLKRTPTLETICPFDRVCFLFLHFYMTIAFSSSHYEALFHSLLLHFPFLLGKWRGTGLYSATDETGGYTALESHRKIDNNKFVSLFYSRTIHNRVVHLINWLQNLAYEITALLQNTNFRNEMSFWQGLFSFLHFYMTIAFSSSHYEALFHSLLLHFPFLLGKWRGTGLYIATDEIGAIQPWRATGKLITTNLSV